MNNLRRLLLALALAAALPLSLRAAVTFVEPGGDSCACFTNWGSTAQTPTIDTTVVHTGRSSLKFTAASPAQSAVTPAGVVTDAGGRVSWWAYLSAPTTNNAQFWTVQNSTPAQVFNIRTSGTTGKVSLNAGGNTLCTGTTVLSANTWYRLSLSWVITNTTTHVIKLYLNGAQECSETNAATLAASGANRVVFNSAPTMTVNGDDFYVDNSTANTEPGEGSTSPMALTIGLRSVGTGVR